MANSKNRIEPAEFIKELESNEKVQAIVSEIKRHMLIHQLHVENGTFTPEYLNTVTYVTAAYLLCLLDTLAKQKQKFKEEPEFDNVFTILTDFQW